MPPTDLVEAPRGEMRKSGSIRPAEEIAGLPQRITVNTHELSLLTSMLPVQRIRVCAWPSPDKKLELSMLSSPKFILPTVTHDET